MKVIYTATPFPTRHNRLGVLLRPGENDVPDEVARELIKLQLVTAADPPEAEDAGSKFSFAQFRKKESRREREAAPAAAASDESTNDEEETK